MTNIIWSNREPITLNLDAHPLVPEGWELVQHQPGGQQMFGPGSMGLYYHDGQKDGKKIVGNKLMKSLPSLAPVLNANVLDWLLANPQYIQEEWVDKTLLFWGTVYRHEFGDLCVRGLEFRRRPWEWGWCSFYLHQRFGSRYPAAVRT